MNEVKKVQIRNGFSDRNKIHPVSNGIQLKELDEKTRNGLANLIQDWLNNLIFEQYQNIFFLTLLKDAYGEYISPSKSENIEYYPMNYFKEYILNPIWQNDYDYVFSLVEFVTSYLIAWKRKTNFSEETIRFLPNYEKELNQLFEKECVGYRFINPCIVPISDETEVNTIQDASKVKYEGCRTHILKALELLSNRENPDYKNSIKESISAVESICQIITGDDKATLGEALKKLESKGLHLHLAMRKAFSELYGYTSDQGGIRHSEGMFTSDVSFEEAKYMLVSCCAFVNFLIAEEAKHER